MHIQERKLASGSRFYLRYWKNGKNCCVSKSAIEKDPSLLGRLEWLNHIATEWHKQFVFLFWPTISEQMQLRLLDTAKEKLEKLNHQMLGKDFVFGDKFSIIDAYMYVALGWLDYVDPNDKLKVANYPELKRYIENLSKRTSFLDALKYEENQFD